MSRHSRLTYAVGHGVRHACALLRHLISDVGPVRYEYCRDREAGVLGRHGPGQFAFVRTRTGGVPVACTSRLVAETVGSV